MQNIPLLLVVLVGLFIFGLGQRYFNWPIITTQNEEYSKGVALYYVPGAHLVSTFAGHYDLAAFLVLVSPWIYLLLVTKKRLLESFKILPTVISSRVFLILSAGMTLWLLVNAASRISVVSYLGSVSLALFLARKYKWIPVVLVAMVIFIASSSNLLDRYTRIFEVTLQNVLSVKIEEPFVAYAQEAEQKIPQRREPEGTIIPVSQPVFEDRSTSIRLNVEWPRAVRAFTKNPLLGTGYSSLTLATDNDYLRMAGEIGIIGVLAFFLILVRILVKLKSAFAFPKTLSIKDVFVIGIVSSLPGILLNMMFIDILEASKFATIFWLLLGMAIAAVNNTNVKKT